MERRGRAAINGRAFAAVCRGGPWASRGHCGGARSPTEVCYNARTAVSRLAAGFFRRLPPLSKGGGRAARRGRRDCPAPKCRPGTGRQPQGNPPVSALAPFDKGAFCAAARFHTFSPKPKPRSNAKPVRRAGTVHNFFTKTAKKLFNFFQMYGKVESLEQTNGPGPPAVWTK